MLIAGNFFSPPDNGSAVLITAANGVTLTANHGMSGRAYGLLPRALLEVGAGLGRIVA